MATDTLSPSSTPASAAPVPAATAPSCTTATPGPGADAAAERRTPSIPNPMTVEVSFPPSSLRPSLTPPPHQGPLPRENGYQFKTDQRDTRLTFVIAPRDRSTHWFLGCRFSPVPDALGRAFPMPGYTYRLDSPFELVVEFKFTPGALEQVHVLPEYASNGHGQHVFDPQVGNDGGDIVTPPRPEPKPEPMP